MSNTNHLYQWPAILACVPHQRPPITYIIASPRHLLSLAIGFTTVEDDLPDDPTVDDCIAACGHDMNACHIWCSVDELAEWIAQIESGEITCHQSHDLVPLLHEAAELIGWGL